MNLGNLRKVRYLAQAFLVPLVVLFLIYLSTRTWNMEKIVRQAETQMKAGQFAEALTTMQTGWSRRIGSFAGTKSYDEMLYLQGICLARLNRPDQAKNCLFQLGDSSPFHIQAVITLSDLLLEEGQWRSAEDLLVTLNNNTSITLSSTEKPELLTRLDRYYRMQCRFQDAADLLSERLLMYNQNLSVLKDHWRTSRGTPPLDIIQQAIKTCESLNPTDSRLRLAKANVALLEGNLDEADNALKQCELESSRPDNTVALARMRWARAANRPDAAIQTALKLNPAELKTEDIFQWSDYFAENSGDTTLRKAILAAWLQFQPGDTAMLSRYAEFSSQQNDPATATTLRNKKAAVDRALDAYNKKISEPVYPVSIDDWLQWSALASACGRLDDAIYLARKAAESYKPELKITAKVDQMEALLAAQQSFRDRSLAFHALWPQLEAKIVVAPKNQPAPEQNRPIIPQFMDHAQLSGLNFQFNNGETAIRQMPVALSGGVGLVDYDNDGWQDIFLVQGGPFPFDPAQAQMQPGDRLFRNLGDNHFQDVTAAAGLPEHSIGYGHGVAVGDVNNDGFSDLFITRFGSYQLYLNDGNGKFTDCTQKYNLGGNRDWPSSAAFADLDNDGDLDLYVCHYVDWDEKNPRLCRNAQTSAYMSCNPTTCAAHADHLFRNDGGKFTDISDSAGITVADRAGRGLGVVAADFDDDGKTDIFVANDKSANFLFRNKGDFKFEEIAHAAGVAGSAEGSYQAGMGVACGDYNRDGRMDLAVTNYYGESTTVYQNLGGMVFTDRTMATGVNSATRLHLGFGTAFSDFNNDGYLDLFTANGHTDDMGDVPYRMPAQLILGTRTNRFYDTSRVVKEPLSIPHLGRGLAVGDLDNDGRVDALLLPQNEPLVYYHNQSSRPDHWLTVKLVGTKSNRDGVGAKLQLKTENMTFQTQRFGGGSYQSANTQRLHFGLGQALKADLLEVQWPSGVVDRIANPPIDRILTIREGSGVAEKMEPKK